MFKNFIAVIAILVLLVSHVQAQRPVSDLRQDLLSQVDLGIPDSSRFLLVAAQLADAAIEEGNLSIARNAAVLISDMLGAYAGASKGERALGYLKNAQVTYRISRRHPVGITLAQTAIDHARQADDQHLELEALYELAMFQRGRRQVEARAQTLKVMEGIAKKDLTRFGKHFGIAQLEMARDFQEGGKLDQAITTAHLAIPYLQGADPELAYRPYDLLGTIYGRQGDYDQSLAMFKLALVARFPSHLIDENPAGHAVPRVDSLKTFWDATMILNHRSKVFRAMKRPDLALNDYHALIKLRGRQRAENVVESSRFRQSRILMEFYSEAIECYYELRDEDPEHVWQALAMSERMKVSNLLFRLSARATGVDESDVLEMRRGIAHSERLEPDGIPTNPDVALQELQLSARLDAQDTDREQFSPYDVEELKAAVKMLDGGLLEYATGYDHTHIFYADNSGQLIITRMPDARRVVQQIMKWRDVIKESAYETKSLRSKNVRDSLDREFVVTGFEIYEALLPAQIRDSLPANLLIVPDGVVNYVPFACLPTDTVRSSFKYENLDYFIDAHRVGYGYSLRHQNALNEMRSEGKVYSLLAFAPQFNGSTTPSDLIAARGEAKQESPKDLFPGLNALVHNVPEAQTAATHISGGEAVVGSAATRESFLERIAEADIIHLSSHGAMSNRHPRYSFVAFSQQGEQLREDELIYYNDLPGYGLDAELVVLSACETSMGMVAPGEVAMTMASAFIDAGARSVVSNLWSVDDAATREFMDFFYTELGEGRDQLTAITEAQRQQRRTGHYTHPFYWGAATLYGKQGSINTQQPKHWPWVLGVLGIGALLFLVFRFLRS